METSPSSTTPDERLYNAGRGLAHPVSTSVFSMLKCQHQPYGGAFDRAQQSNRQDHRERHEGPTAARLAGPAFFCMISIAGITMCPTIRMVKYGGGSSARARPSGA